MTRCTHGGKACDHIYAQAFYHPQFPARHSDGSRLRELIVAIVVLVLIIAFLTWANGSVPVAAAWLAAL